MLRAILAVIAGYVTMAATVLVTFTGTYAVLGAEGSFRPGSYEVSSTWIVASFVLSLVAAILGGLVCRSIARAPRPVTALVVLVLVLGALSAIPVWMSSGAPLEARVGEVGNFEAMSKARQPLWVALVVPLVGAAGVMLGGRRSR
jgi:hypothetical protein